MPDLHARLLAEVERRLAIAREASRAHDGATPTGEHWHWECHDCDAPVVINDVVLLDEFLACGACGSYGFDLRSSEKYDTTVGPLPHMAVRYVEELRPVAALHVQINASPDDAIRRYERDLRVLRRHRSFEQKDWSVARGSFTAPGCTHCELTSNDGDPLARNWPCPEITDLAEALGVTIEETT